MKVRLLFEKELRARGLNFRIEPATDRYELSIGGGTMLVSLDNLTRDFERDGDIGRIARFVDAIEAAADEEETLQFSPAGLFWSLETNDLEEGPGFREPVSECLDRILIHQSADGKLLTWVTPDMLTEMSLTPEDASQLGFAHLADELLAAEVEYDEIDGVRLGYLSTQLAFKASLLLAPNLKAVVSPHLGWPLLAVCPDRDFLYLWSAEHQDFIGRVGGVVVEQFQESAYPLSTEVFRVDDDGLKAIGAFPTDA
jgi:hypothetical protein